MVKLNVDLIIGGGKWYFDWCKLDDCDLLVEFQSRGYMVVDYFNGQLYDVRLDFCQLFVFFMVDN